MSTSDWANLDELNERAEDDMTTTKDAQNWNRLHHVLKKHGLHPGRTDDDIIDIVDAALASKQAPTHVGDSSFEGWFATYDPAGKGDKQRARDAYAAGLGEQAEAQAKSEPADLQRIELSDGAWLERGGPLSIWGLYRANTGHLRELNRFEREFIDCTIRAAIAAQGGGTKA